MGVLGILMIVFGFFGIITYLVLSEEDFPKKGYRSLWFIALMFLGIGITTIDTTARPIITTRIISTDYLPGSGISFTHVTKVEIRKTTYPGYSVLHGDKTTYKILD